MIAGGGAPELGTPEFITELSDVIDIGSQSLERVQHDLYEKLSPVIQRGSCESPPGRLRDKSLFPRSLGCGE